jgi:hypothetical protein
MDSDGTAGALVLPEWLSDGWLFRLFDRWRYMNLKYWQAGWRLIGVVSHDCLGTNKIFTFESVPGYWKMALENYSVFTIKMSCYLDRNPVKYNLLRQQMVFKTFLKLIHKKGWPGSLFLVLYFLSLRAICNITHYCEYSDWCEPLHWIVIQNNL